MQHDMAKPAPMDDEPALAPSTLLVMPLARSAHTQWGLDETGAQVLTLYYLSHEIVFDDPRHFAFGENLAARARFEAGEAAEWGALGWIGAAELLTQLIGEGVLRPASPDEAAEPRHDNQPAPSPLPPAPMAAPRCWTDEASLMQALTGTTLDENYLELVVPIFRVAHLFLDRDGRQVGEANVFPMTARLDVPTDWRGCSYPGNRYQAEKPMNVTALRAMRQHWRAMMALLARCRENYLARFTAARAGWTVGDVERLCTAVLALPSYLLLRRDGPVANGDLHPVLSNLFRVTDGLRMVMHQMMFVPLHEAMVGPEAPVNSAMILAYADRNFSFHSDHGVCAGPRFMIEDFLGVLLDGTEPRGGIEAEADPELESAAALIGPATDYALCGLTAHFTAFALWPAMIRCYDRLRALLADADGPAEAIAARFEAHFAALNTRSFLANEDWRRHREGVYDTMIAQCTEALTGSAPTAPLSALIADAATPAQDAVLSAAFRAVLKDEARADAAAATVMDFLRRGQRIAALCEAAQARTGALLHRPAPAHRLTLAHLNLHNVLMGEDVRTVPFLPDELAAVLGIDIHVDAETIRIANRPHAGSLTRSPRVTPGEFPAHARSQ